ncbi:acyltransferase family protein [Rhodococcus koreensis]|uniref:acyltransferase family protein n=1 Tax=Rhodococcus koreensis TaxID=99653 RepID=UPI00197D0D91|nr:acyltransferase [Rhodococcus koreensis]QSE86985.1 acyltransferase [Rhodococcus koreensis]
MDDRHFARIDGLRAVSVLLVLTIHSKVTLLHRYLHGWIGVTIFFVISGFLITTLLLREESRTGRINLSGFYIRRVFRILPLYYLALALTCIAVALRLADDPSPFWPRLVYFLTYTNEFAPDGTFGHTWSLGIEEKFYLIWPAVAFLIPVAVKRRGWIGATVLATTSVLGLVAPSTYVGLYAPILAGCVLALVLNNPRGFEIASQAAKPTLGIAFLALFVLAVVVNPENTHMQVLVGLTATLAFPFLLFGPPRIMGWLAHPWLMHVGTLSYAIYLFHPLIGSAVSAVIPTERGVAYSLLHLLGMTVATIAFAEIMRRLVEAPLIARGRAIANRKGSSLPLAQEQAPSTLPL